MQEKNPSTNDSGAPGHEMLDQKKHEFDSRTYKIPQNTEVSSSMHVSDIDSNMNPNEQFTKAYIENNISDDNSNNASGQNNEPGQADNSYKNDFNAICTTLKKMKEDFENKFTNINDRFDQLEGNLEERIAMLQSDSKSTLKLMIDKVHSDLKIAIIDSISSKFSSYFRDVTSSKFEVGKVNEKIENLLKEQNNLRDKVNELENRFSVIEEKCKNIDFPTAKDENNESDKRK